MAVWSLFAPSWLLAFPGCGQGSFAPPASTPFHPDHIESHCCGEQWGQDLGLYYNRARYLNTDSGRFWNQDSYEGASSDPSSLHKYLYANANPIMRFDPTGRSSLMDMAITVGIVGTLGGIVGATIGGIDSTLSGGSFADGAINGAKWGAGLSVASLVPGLGLVIGVGGSFVAGYGIGSAINDENYGLAGFRLVTVVGAFSIANFSGKVPPGFKTQGDFFKFGAKLGSGLNRTYPDTVAYLGGSGASGRSYTTGAPFGPASDYDIALVGDSIFEAASQARVGLRGQRTRTGPLNAADLEALGLSELAADLSALAGREVNFMIFQDAATANARGNTIAISP